eukprot:1157659-Pelagomonas_calceolata.AAC.13
MWREELTPHAPDMISCACKWGGLYTCRLRVGFPEEIEEPHHSEWKKEKESLSSGVGGMFRSQKHPAGVLVEGRRGRSGRKV